MAPLSFSLLFLLVGSAFSYSIPFRRQDGSLYPQPNSTTVRVNGSGPSIGFTNAENMLFSATLYIQGQAFQVQIDTGSADLWIDTSTTNVTLEGLIDTGYNATVGYVDTTTASGPIQLANVTLGDYTVEGLAFINAYGSNETEIGLNQGLLGVGPPFISNTAQVLFNTSYNGFNFLDNVFSYYPNDSHFTSFILERNDFGITEGGVMTISELVKEYEAIVDTPKLEVFSELAFATFMDGITINGELLTGHSLSADSPEITATPGPNQTVVVLDTGTTFGQAPPYYVDALYKNIPGATFNDEYQAYVVPCDTKMNVSMVFGNNSYPMDPLDAVSVTTDDNNTVVCIGTFFYVAETAGVDFILGDAFLHNVYSLFSYGNWSASGTGTPYMQILSIIDPDEAWANFATANAARFAGAEAFATATSYGPIVGTQTQSFSLVEPSAATGTPTAATGVTSTPTTPTSSPASASPGSGSASPSTAPSPSGSGSNSGTGSSSGTPTVGGGALLAAAVSPTTSLAPVTKADLSTLTRNSYIIMGLAGGALALLLGIAGKMCMDRRAASGGRGGGGAYRAVPTLGAGGPAHFGKPYEAESEPFSTPYDDPARAAGYTQ